MASREAYQWNDIKRCESVLVHKQIAVLQNRPIAVDFEGKPLRMSLQVLRCLGRERKLEDTENLRRSKPRSVKISIAMTTAKQDSARAKKRAAHPVAGVVHAEPLEHEEEDEADGID